MLVFVKFDNSLLNDSEKAVSQVEISDVKQYTIWKSKPYDVIWLQRMNILIIMQHNSKNIFMQF